MYVLLLPIVERNRVNQLLYVVPIYDEANMRRELAERQTKTAVDIC
jgi:hypothetical protein